MDLQNAVRRWQVTKAKTEYATELMKNILKEQKDLRYRFQQALEAHEQYYRSVCRMTYRAEGEKNVLWEVAVRSIPTTPDRPFTSVDNILAVGGEPLRVALTRYRLRSQIENEAYEDGKELRLVFDKLAGNLTKRRSIIQRMQIEADDQLFALSKELRKESGDGWVSGLYRAIPDLAPDRIINEGSDSPDGMRGWS